MLTVYDALTARVFDDAGIPVLLVGDSASMVVFGHDTTIPVTVDDLLPLTAAVVRGSSRAMVVADLPFGSYQTSPEAALSTAIRFLKETGAHAVKLEGGVEAAELVRRLVRAGIPVMGHVGMTPQSVHQLGGFKIQGRTEAQRAQILADARAVSEAGAYAVVIEAVPHALAAEITRDVSALTIGIGAGADCDGQVMVMHDLLGLEPAWKPRFVRRYAEMGKAVGEAFVAYAADVRAGRFPAPEETYD